MNTKGLASLSIVRMFPIVILLWLFLTGYGQCKIQVVCISTCKVNGLIPRVNEHKVWGRIKLCSLNGRKTYKVSCINVDSMQEVTDSLYQTICRCFPQLHLLYW